MKPLKADLLLFMVTICWGSSYLFMKMGLDTLESSNLVALRFGIAFILTALLFTRQLFPLDRKTIAYAALLGLMLFMTFALATTGLLTTTTSNAGFLISLAAIFVPVLNNMLFKKKTEPRLMASIVLALSGIALLAIHIPFHITSGDLLCIVSAFFYAIHITVAGFAAKTCNTLQLGIWQLGFTGLYALLFSLFFEKPALPSTSVSWAAILILSILCSAIGFTVQLIAQKYTTAVRTGLIFSMEPVFAAIIGCLFAGEAFSFKGYLGAGLVLISILISVIPVRAAAKSPG